MLEGCCCAFCAFCAFHSDCASCVFRVLTRALAFFSRVSPGTRKLLWHEKTRRNCERNRWSAFGHLKPPLVAFDLIVQFGTLLVELLVRAFDLIFPLLQIGSFARHLLGLLYRGSFFSHNIAFPSSNVVQSAFQRGLLVIKLLLLGAPVLVSF